MLVSGQSICPYCMSSGWHGNLTPATKYTRLLGAYRLVTTLAQQVVLKEGSIFLVSHENGDISGNAGLGLYYKDMRYLSLLSLKINEQTPPLLSFSGHRTFMGT